MPNQSEESTSIERHFVTVLVGISVLLIGSGVIALFSMSSNMATMQTNLSWVQTSMTNMENKIDSATANNYSNTDASRDMTTVMGRIDSVESRISIMESDHRNFMNGKPK